MREREQGWGKKVGEGMLEKGGKKERGREGCEPLVNFFEA